MNTANDNQQQEEFRKKETTEDKANKQAEQLIKAVNDQPGIELFHDEYQDSFARLPYNSGSMTIPLQGKRFKSFLRALYFKKTKTGISKDILEKVVGTLDAIAQFDGKQHKLSVRVAQFENAYWYDLGECVIRIDNFGWSIVSNAPILFRQYPVQLSQVLPEKGGSLKQIFDYINVTKSDDKILFLTFLVSCFIPDIPHPILTIIGPQGAAKTTLEKVILGIVDPSMTEDVPANDMRELEQAVSHRWVVPFDNLSNISKGISDFLCKLVTGGSYTRRQLYSDDDDIIRRFRRVPILNGINMPIYKADVLDRCLILDLERIKSSIRLDEKTLLADFEKERPKLLGACFDTLSKAIYIYPSVRLSEKPRMADFAMWGCAIAEAIGWSQKEFLDAYQRNISRQTLEALDASSLGTVLLYYFETFESIEGTPSGVLETLRGQVEKAGAEMKFFPTSPRSLGRQLQGITPNLEFLGYRIERSRTFKERWIKITRPSFSDDDVTNVKSSEIYTESRQDDVSDINSGKKVEEACFSGLSNGK